MSSVKSDIVITPATWPERGEALAKTATGLLDVVGWYGSTHRAATWRKADEFLAVFRDRQITGFDPQIDAWDPSFIAIESEVMARAATLIIRLENNELLNGSLGSIAEIGVALTSAFLRGQVVIISIEDNLLTSLAEPGAIAQYMVLEMCLEHFGKFEALTAFFQVHRGDDLQELAALACRAARQQRERCRNSLEIEIFLKKREERRQNNPLMVVLSGSGGPYSQAYEEAFQKKRALLRAPCLANGYKVKDLAEGAIAAAWKIPYGSLDSIATALAMRTIITVELEYKWEADLLLAPILTESASKAAVTWLGFLLLQALISGQDVKIFFEPFDPVDYVYHQLNLTAVEDPTAERQARQALQQAGVPDKQLATATRADVLETFALLQAMAQTKKPSFKQVKQSLLGQTDVFQNADNIRRVRALVQAHLEELQTEERFSDLFYYSTSVGD